MIRFEQTEEDPGYRHVVVDVPSGVGISEFVDAVRMFALALGYHPENVKEYLGDPE